MDRARPEYLGALEQLFALGLNNLCLLLLRLTSTLDVVFDVLSQELSKVLLQVGNGLGIFIKGFNPPFFDSEAPVFVWLGQQVFDF